MKMLKRFMKDDKGLETVEYAVMTALVVAAMVVAIGALAGAITGRFGATQGGTDFVGVYPANPLDLVNRLYDAPITPVYR